jgi:hypothetical protein
VCPQLISKRKKEGVSESSYLYFPIEELVYVYSLFGIARRIEEEYRKGRICIYQLKQLFMCTLYLELQKESKRSIYKVVFVFPNLKKLFMCTLWCSTVKVYFQQLYTLKCRDTHTRQGYREAMKELIKAREKLSFLLSLQGSPRPLSRRAVSLRYQVYLGPG